MRNMSGRAKHGKKAPESIPRTLAQCSKVLLDRVSVLPFRFRRNSTAAGGAPTSPSCTCCLTVSSNEHHTSRMHGPCGVNAAAQCHRSTCPHPRDRRPWAVRSHAVLLSTSPIKTLTLGAWCMVTRSMTLQIVAYTCLPGLVSHVALFNGALVTRNYPRRL